MALFLFAVWLILNGSFRADVLITGALATGVILFFACRFLDWSLRREYLVYCAIPEAVGFAGLMLEEIVLANLAVAKILIHGKPKPVVRTFTTELSTGLGRVLLANAITLTPGTVTLRCEGERLTVHCLDESLAAGLDGSKMEKKIARMEAALHE